MRMLILGGTGAMGAHLSELAIADGWEVFVTTRSNRTGGAHLHYLYGNARDVSFLDTILVESWDVIVDFMVYRTREFANRATKLLSACGQYLFLSSARVYADSKLPLTEDSPRLLDVCTDAVYLATDEYALAKARQENQLFDSKHQNWTIIRPYITYSEQRLQLGVLEKEAWLYRALQGRSVVFSREINARRTTMTYGRDVALSMLATCGNKSALGEAFHITAENSILWSDVLESYLFAFEAFQGRRPRVRIESVEDFPRIHQGHYQIIYDRYYDRVFDNKKLKQLGPHLRFQDARSGIEKCLNEFLQKPAFLAVNWQAEAVKDKIAQERTSLSEIYTIKSKLKYLKVRYF